MGASKSSQVIAAIDTHDALAFSAKEVFVAKPGSPLPLEAPKFHTTVPGDAASVGPASSAPTARLAAAATSAPEPSGTLIGNSRPSADGTKSVSDQQGRFSIQDRLKIPLKVAKGREVFNKTPPKQELRTIKIVDNFKELYELGSEVMPSGHTHMKIRHAFRRSDGHKVVIKERSKPYSFATPEDEKRWRASTEMLLNFMGTDRIALFYEVLEDNWAYYVVMEKVPGMDLFETLDNEGLMPVQEVKEVLFQLLRGVADLHERGIIHKDLKLENVMLDRTSSTQTPNVERQLGSEACLSVKLIDFDTVEEWSPEMNSKARNVIGSDQYIAQEAYGGDYSPASDIFAVGVIGYRLLTGRLPFRRELFDDKAGENWVGSPKMVEIQEKLQMSEIDWSRKIFKTEPGALDICRKMLCMRGTDRPKAVEALRYPWLLDRATLASPSNRLPDVSPGLDPLAGFTVRQKATGKSYLDHLPNCIADESAPAAQYLASYQTQVSDAVNDLWIKIAADAPPKKKLGVLAF